jgi:hypothetical protein
MSFRAQLIGQESFHFPFASLDFSFVICWLAKLRSATNEK